MVDILLFLVEIVIHFPKCVWYNTIINARAKKTTEDSKRRKDYAGMVKKRSIL